MVIMKCPLHVKQILEKKAHLVPNICVHNPGHTRWRRASLCPNDSFLFKKSIQSQSRRKKWKFIGNWKLEIHFFLNSKYYTHTTHTIPLYCYAVSMIYQRYGYAMYLLCMVCMVWCMHCTTYSYIYSHKTYDTHTLHCTLYIDIASHRILGIYCWGMCSTLHGTWAEELATEIGSTLRRH